MSATTNDAPSGDSGEEQEGGSAAKMTYPATVVLREAPMPTAAPAISCAKLKWPLPA